MDERLWAPWRMAFVSGEKKDDSCLFCRVREEERDRENFVLWRNTHTLTMLNAYPYTSGHLMVVPYAHTAAFDELDASTLLELMGEVQQGIRALEKVYRPQGFNVGLNLGSAAGAGIAEHLHVHIVPRWEGDTNFMHAVGHTRVLPESLDSSYDRIWNALVDLET